MTPCGHKEAFQMVPSGNAAWYCKRCDDQPKQCDKGFGDEWRNRIPNVGEHYRVKYISGKDGIVSIVDIGGAIIEYHWEESSKPKYIYKKTCWVEEWLVWVKDPKITRIK